MEALEFKSPNDPNASVCSKTKVVYAQLRTNAPKMYGVFCTNKIRAGEFICAWGGVSVEDSPKQRLETHVENAYDLVQYVFQYKLGRKKIVTCIRLGVDGKPLNPHDERLKDTDRGSGVFMNEPSKFEVARLVEESKVVIEQVESNRPNVCMLEHKQPKERLKCPVMYADRDIEKGEELVWFYGPLYVREGEYRESVDTKMRTGCAQQPRQEIKFKQPLPISELTRDSFLIREENESWKRRYLEMLVRTEQFLKELDFVSNINTMTFADDAKRVARDRRRCDKMRKAVTDAYLNVCDTFEPKRLKIRHNESKVLTIFRILLNELVTIQVLETTDQMTGVSTGVLSRVLTPTLGKHFFLDATRAYAMIDVDDDNWGDILVMQKAFWIHMKDPITNNTTYSTFMKKVLDPDIYAGIFYKNNDYKAGIKETVQSWNAAEFVSDAQKVLEFFRAIVDLREMAYGTFCRNIQSNADMPPSDKDFADLLHVIGPRLFRHYKELLGTTETEIPHYATFKKFVRDVEEQLEYFEKEIKKNVYTRTDDRRRMGEMLRQMLETSTIHECMEALQKNVAGDDRGEPPLKKTRRGNPPSEQQHGNWLTTFRRNPFAPALDMLQRLNAETK